MAQPGEQPAPRDRSNETTAAGVPWVAFSRCREQYRPTWPSVFRMRLVLDHYDLVTRPRLPVRSLLDVGATDRVHEAKARAAWPGLDYRSLDIDRTNRHDYHDFADVDRTFDLVTLLEVLEHVPQKDCIHLVKDCFRACRSGGHLLASVPNIYTPGAQEEMTHVTALHYLDLAGVLAWVGFEVVDAARVYFASRRRRLVHTKLLHPLHRLMGVDYAQSIVVLGRKP